MGIEAQGAQTRTLRKSNPKGKANDHEKEEVRLVTL